ncbi:Cytosolic endo-beta-N-acetylglucosaminidase [Harpegnathos saltator]|uniref:Cytosolic endo-beta-N-acetylglucosaminidase n=1 Tax=Harpegnathos saltator TaxID=610380 RepID=E2C4H4_HARSA|nr:Cytosolic endo-beta-N-acetylglucosaminidase [Harpegnathos saltator]
MENSSLLETEQDRSERMIDSEPNKLETQQNESDEIVRGQLSKLETESDGMIKDEPDKPRESKPFDTMLDLYHVLDRLIPYPETDIVESVDFTYRGSEIANKKTHLQKIDKEKSPRTIVCHDMKGGYLEDRFFWGSTSHDSYLFYNWYAIDTFIYFSHHFITVPPYGWICAAHKHGVKILGTIITEENTSVYEFWQSIVESYDNLQAFADALVTLTKRYGFDGWLLNFETNFTKNDFRPSQPLNHVVDKVLYFVKYLTETLHKEVENSEVIWYDSLVKVGALAWQNELNEENKDFFLNCDGIYLNYQWTKDHLDRTNTLVKQLGRDVRDVYVGLDIFARGTSGVGEFNCSDALDAIRKYNFSVAIFAPGWTHEHFGPNHFNIVDDIFWTLLFPYLHIHVPIYEDETFRSTFCRGAGTCYYYNGQEHSLPERLNEGKGFYELRLQQPQLSVPVRILDLKNTTYTHLIAGKSAADKTIKILEEDDADIGDDIKTPMTRIEELYLKWWHIIEENENLTDKSIVLRGNTFEYCEDFSYEGGGCLRVITRNEKLYHRLFLVYVNFKLYIQASLVYAEAETNASTREPPILILGRNSAFKAIQPYDHSRVNDRWWKCTYLTDFKTVDEIGVLFRRNCVCYLGEVVLDKYDQIFGK